MTGPVFIHLLTQKGRGLDHAETNSSRFHGIGPYNHETGHTASSGELSWSHVFGNKLCEMAERNDKIVAVTAAMTDGTGLCGFEERFKERIFDVGIAEQHAVTFSAGMAIKGLRPYVAIYSSFLQRAVDQIIHDVALQKLPVVFCIDRAGIVGEDGVTHQGVFDLSYLQFIPNLTIISPTTDKELCDAMEWSQNWNDGPIAIRYPRGIAVKLENRNEKLEIKHGKADVWEEGKEIAITGVGNSFWIAKELYEMIIKDYPKVKPYLINPLFIKPYDKEIYDKIYNKCKYHFVIEENAQIGGFASRLSLEYNLSDCKTIPFSIPDMFIEHGAPDLLRNLLGLNAESIYDVVARLALASTKE